MSGIERALSPYQAFKDSAQRSPLAPFLIAPASAQLPYARDGFYLSYGEIDAKVEATRAACAAAGYGRGARVAMLLDSRPEFFVQWLALNALGTSIVPINPDLRPDELACQLSLADVDLAVGSQERIAPLAKELDFTRFRPVAVGAHIPDCRKTILGQTGAFESECALLFTSGSTGKPKGCMLSNRYFMQVAEWYRGQGGIAALV